jgi:hypothetical protein
MSRLTLALLLAALAAGCAQLRWHKAGADAAALERDLMECQVRATRLAGPAVLFAPDVVGVDERGRVVMGRSSRLESDRLMLEHDLTGACMRERGYELVPVNKKK